MRRIKKRRTSFSKTHKIFVWVLSALLFVELIFVVDTQITGNPILKTVEKGVDVFGGGEIICEPYQKNVLDGCVTSEEKLGAFRVMPPSPNLLEEVDKGNNNLPEFFYDGRLIEGIPPTKKINFDKLSQDKDGVSQFKLLVVLVDFSDKPGQETPAFFDNLVFGNKGSTVKNYYLENSYGKFELTTLNLPSSLGWIRAPNPYSYYVGGVGGTGVYPHNSQGLAEDMIGILNPLVDFSEYDNDNDGYVDAILFIHSGSGGEFTGNGEDMWSHKWSIFPSLYVDGVHASVYATTPEYWNAPYFEQMTIGVISHELGHAMLLLPDLYDTDGSSVGIGRWDLMASGAWNGENGMGSSPSHFSAWSKIVSGFAEPIVVEDNSIITDLFPSSFYLNNIYKLGVRDNSQEYFLIEFRPTERFDSYLPGSGGILIWHVDESFSGNNREWYPSHTNEGHYLVALEQADSLWQLEKKESVGDYGDPFYKRQYGEDDLADCSFESSGIFSSMYYNSDFSGVCMEIVSFGESSVKVVLSDQNNCRDFVDLDNDEISLCEGDCDDNDSIGLYNQYVFPDDDSDGYYSFEAISECLGEELPQGYSLERGSDCDDTNRHIHPGVWEICNEIDDDCDGVVDEVNSFFYLDEDGDGYGVEENSIYVPFCPIPSGYARAKGDCDDSNPLINPGRTEVCTDGIDNNCNGMIDFEEDVDSDGYSTCNGDCDDTLAEINPGAKEICYDYIDNDCDGLEDSLDSDCTCSGNGGICTLSSRCPVGYKKIYNSVDYFCSGDSGCCLPLKVATPSQEIIK